MMSDAIQEKVMLAKKRCRQHSEEHWKYRECGYTKNMFSDILSIKRYVWIAW